MPATDRRWRSRTARSGRRHRRRRKGGRQRIGQARGAVNPGARAPGGPEAEHEERMLVEETVDVTLPTDRVPTGARHPLTTGAELIADIFVAMGWEVAEVPSSRPVAQLRRAQPRPGPPGAHHAGHLLDRPADDHLVLRTHTSPVQARTMPPRTPPIYVVTPAACSGPTSTTPRTARCSPGRGPRRRRGHHDGPPQGTLDHPAAQMFGEGINTRFRPMSHFPFTEPSAEVDLVCFVCTAVPGSWTEPLPDLPRRGLDRVGGCGRQPPVLTACGVDAERYTGLPSAWASTGR